MFIAGLVLLTALIAPTPEQYYASSLAAMNALPQPAFATFDMQIRASGAGVKAECHKEAAAFSVGWGGGMLHSLQVTGAYRAADRAAAFLENGNYCRDDVAFFKPAWPAVHDWIRYGMSEPPRAVAASTPTPLPRDLPTIASVTSLAPSAYDVQDMGAARCPSGSDGHALHFIAKYDPDKHPLMDAVVEVRSMRLCMLRLRLVGATAVGTGAKGDVTLEMGQAGAYWMVTHTRAILSLRLFGAALKSLAFDTDYTGIEYPSQLPASVFAPHT